MKRRFAFPGLLIITAMTASAQELPKSDDALEIEPPLLIQEAPDRGAVESNPVKKDPATPRTAAQVEQDLERATRSAASAERLFKIGVLAKVEAEKRTLRVVRLQAELADARLREAKQNPDVASSLDQLALLAKAAADKLAGAEVAAAEINVRRQQKLLSLGSGRKSDVSRAQEKLAALQQTAH